jgi:hypothetical protein
MGAWSWGRGRVGAHPAGGRGSTVVLALARAVVLAPRWELGPASPRVAGGPVPLRFGLGSPRLSAVAPVGRSCWWPSAAGNQPLGYLGPLWVPWWFLRLWEGIG